MSFLSRLFGKKPQPKVVENKVVNLEAMSLDALVSVIQSTGDEQMRLAAIQKISDQSTLLTIAGLSDKGLNSTLNAVIQKAAKQRIAQLIDSGAINGEQLCETISDKNALLSILGLTNSNVLFEKVFASIGESELAVFALEGATNKLRQRAAEKITDRNVLLQLLKDTKTKDKSVFKIVKEKCDLFKEEEKRIAEFAAATNAVVQSLEQHSKRSFDGQFSARFSYLEQQWTHKKPDATPALVAQAEEAIKKCQEIIAKASVEQVQQEQQRKAVVEADSERETLIGELYSLLESVIEGEVNADVVKNQLDTWDANWQQLTAIKTAAEKEKRVVKSLTIAIYDELAAQTTHGNITEHKNHFEQLVSGASEDVTASYKMFKGRVKNLTESLKDNIPESVGAAQIAYEKWEKISAEKSAELQNTYRHVAGLIRKANETVTSGVLGKAMGIRRAIDEKLQTIEQLPNYLANQLEQLDETLAKLQDWKNYAVLPKKHELIAQLEALDGSKEHPETLSVKIKRLQEEWKSLSKGGNDQDQELWEKFHELAQKVYQPCREYFAEQAAIRQNNLNSCKQLVAQLQDYLENYNWQSANWKDVEKVVRVARQEWRGFTPTERVATQPVLADFESVLAKIQQKIHDEFARNAGLKKELIAQAQQLTHLEDSRKATDEVKALQARWQSIGASLRKEEQQLWREFRDICDAVFAKRQQQSAEFKAELDANLATAKKLITELEGFLSLTAQALTDARKRVDEIRQEFGGLGQFPKAQVNDIKTAFNQVIEAFEKKIKDERIALKQQIWVNLFSANNLVRIYEIGLVQGKSPDIAKLQEQIDSITQWPAGGLKAIQQKIASANSAADVNANLATLRELCIRAEILTDTATPAADQALRTAYQVNQLQQSFGRKTQNMGADFENLIFEWIVVGAVETSDYEVLFTRFNNCRLKAIN